MFIKFKSIESDQNAAITTNKQIRLVQFSLDICTKSIDQFTKSDNRMSQSMKVCSNDVTFIEINWNAVARILEYLAN